MFENISTLRQKFNINKNDNYVIALAGNPNTGKTTLFNALTGLRQHTGNWPGKTVIQTQGEFSYKNHDFLLVDLPGAYSLIPNSLDEQVARDFLCFAKPDVTIAVADATCLERNLNLILQIIEITPQVILCLNLMDEAKRKNIKVNVEELSKELGIPVIPTAARSGKGIRALKNTLVDMVDGKIKAFPRQVNYDEDIEERVREIQSNLKECLNNFINPRWLALRILDGDRSLLDMISEYLEIDGGVFA